MGGFGNNTNIEGLRHAGLASFDAMADKHPTSSWWGPPLTAIGFAGIETIRYYLEKSNHAVWSNILSGFNFGPGFFGVTADLFRIKASGHKPLANPKLYPALRIGFAGGAGFMVGLGAAPDPHLRFGFMSGASMRRGMVDTMGYMLYGQQKVNPLFYWNTVSSV